MALRVKHLNADTPSAVVRQLVSTVNAILAAVNANPVTYGDAVTAIRANAPKIKLIPELPEALGTETVE